MSQGLHVKPVSRSSVKRNQIAPETPLSRDGGLRLRSANSITSTKEAEVNDDELPDEAKQAKALYRELAPHYSHNHPTWPEMDEVKYPYGIVLTNEVKPGGLTLEQLREFQESLIEFLVRSGIKLRLLSHDRNKGTHYKGKYIVLLVKKFSEEQIRREAGRQRVDQFLTSGVLTRHRPKIETPAEVVGLMHTVIERSMDRVRLSEALFDEAGRQDSPVQWSDVVASSGPLHNLDFNNRFFSEFVSRKNVFAWNLDELLCHLRDQFGERVAFYFYFVDFYTRWLVPLAVFMVLFYLIFRTVDWGLYQRGLAILGLTVPTVWCTLMIIFWKRKSARLCYTWRIHNSPDNALPNPHKVEFKWQYNPVTLDKEKKYDPRRNRCKLKIFVPFFTVINISVLILVTTPFIQWYVFSKLAPVCECCEWYMGLPDAGGIKDLTQPTTDNCEEFRTEALAANATGTFTAPSSCTYFLTCFNAEGSTLGTDRWLFILFQGILLGIILDVVQFNFFAWVTDKFTRLESWPTERIFEARVIRKQYDFIWFNMFFWFLFIAFVYVPFGEHLQSALIQIGFGWTVPGFGWRAGVINIDEAFVTPLIVTQALNLVIETVIPYLCNKKARSLYKQRRALMRKLKAAQHKMGEKIEKLADAVHTPNNSDSEGQEEAKVQARPQPAEQGLAEPEASEGAARAAPAGGEVSVEVVGAGRVGQTQAGAGVGAGAGSAGVHKVEVQSSAQGQQGRDDDHAQYEADIVPHTPASLQHWLRAKWGKTIPHLTLGDDENDYTDEDVVEQLMKAPFHPRIDYLDMFMQLGYVLQFTTAWALAPVPAAINNVLELRGDVLKMMTGHRRPVPVREKGILEWEKVLDRAQLFGMLTTIGLICVGTGQLEYWTLPGCIEASLNNAEAIMGPDLTCFDSWGWRLLAYLGLFIVSDFVVDQLRSSIALHDPHLRTLIRGDRAKAARKEQEKLLPELPATFLRDFRVVFKHFGQADAVLSHAECKEMFHKLNEVAFALNNAAPAKLRLEKLRLLEPSDHEALFQMLDVDDSDTISFPEAALAMSRCESDPFLNDAIGIVLTKAVEELAQQYSQGHLEAAVSNISAGSTRSPLPPVVHAPRASPLSATDELLPSSAD